MPRETVVAFRQTVAYRLFSDKSYIAVLGKTSSDDMGRLKSLCSIDGVGLVFFTLDKGQPDYSVSVVATLASPDMFYVNTMLDRLKKRPAENAEPAFLRLLASRAAPAP